MPLYDLPETSLSNLKSAFRKYSKNRVVWLVICTIIISSAFGFVAGGFSGFYFSSNFKGYLEKLNLLPLVEKNSAVSEKVREYVPQTTQEQAVINAVKEASPAVVSIIVTKEVPIMEQYFSNPFGGIPGFEIPQYRQKGTQKQEIGGGTGFIISSDGFILTNKHVVSDAGAEYAVFTNDGKKFPARVLAKDPVQDLAIIKIDPENSLTDKGEYLIKSFPVVKLGSSSNLEIGQTVIAIGNALGQFRNTVSVGVISSLGRTISASGGGIVETLEDIIQTDAAINAGNSGGPLLNLKGEVIGVNTATALAAQSIGFSIPIDKAARDINQVEKTGKISYPFLGVRYVVINEQLKSEKNLPVDYGVLLMRGDQGEPAVTAGSAAEKVGLKEGDIILEFNNEKITTDNSLAKIISKYNPGDKITLKVLQDGKEQAISVILGERTE